MNKWEIEEIKYLTDNYNSFNIEEISKELGRSKNSIFNKASRLFLTTNKNSKKYTVDELINIANKYKSRVEFRDKDWNAYKWANHNDLLDDVCEYDKSFSIPQLVCKKILEDVLNEKCLYNTRKIIPPYEIDIFFDKWDLAIEYNGKGWHKNPDNDIRKHRICKDNNINLITIVENSRRYEEDVKSQLNNNIDLINNITCNNLTMNDINNVVIDIYSLVPKHINLEEEILQYSSYKELKKENLKLYQKIKRYKKIPLIYELLKK